MKEDRVEAHKNVARVEKNITEAAKKATASRRGEVKQIELLGRAIS